MERLEELLVKLPERHRDALIWFAENAGTDQPWPKVLRNPKGETLLASKAKGIYKPSWSTYALSVRQSLDGPYPDQEPIVRPDGTWLYSYFQENKDPSARDDEYTNRGLIACWRDRVPVGVMRQVIGKPIPRYRILGLAMVSGWDGGYFFLEGFSPHGYARSRGPDGELELLATKQVRESLETGAFDPSGVIDARERAIAQIVRRRGQPDFRRKLIEAYEARCAISGCEAVEVLEAVHITPYKGPATNIVQNGLLLRADLHTLFDLGLITVEAETLRVIVGSTLQRTIYRELTGKELRAPKDPSLHPSSEALRLHRQWSGL